MTDEDWDSGFGKSVAVYFNGLGIPGTDPMALLLGYEGPHGFRPTPAEVRFRFPLGADGTNRAAGGEEKV